MKFMYCAFLGSVGERIFLRLYKVLSAGLIVNWHETDKLGKKNLCQDRSVK